MKYLLYFILTLVVVDLLRSIIAVRQAVRLFRLHKTKRLKLRSLFGKGPAFHLAILGDSAFDVRGDSKVTYGAAQAFINELAHKHEVHVHMLARAGAKSRDVIEAQLPKLKALPHLDLIVVYIGANDVLRLKNPFRVGKFYRALFKFTEKRKIPVIASEIANYWHLGIFALIHRALLYMFIHIQNLTIQSAARNCRYAVIIKTKPYHKLLHKQRNIDPYLSDGVHPNDKASLGWGKYLLEHAKESPATARVFLK